MKNSFRAKNISWNQVFTKVVFTKFLSEMDESKFPKLQHSIRVAFSFFTMSDVYFVDFVYNKSFFFFTNHAFFILYKVDSTKEKFSVFEFTVRENEKFALIKNICQINFLVMSSVKTKNITFTKFCTSVAFTFPIPIWFDI